MEANFDRGMWYIEEKRGKKSFKGIFLIVPFVCICIKPYFIQIQAGLCSVLYYFDLDGISRGLD